MKTLRLSAACAIAMTLAVGACAEKAPVAASVAESAGATPSASAPVAQPLTIEVYNPGEQGIFAVSSTLVTGAKDAVLIDAQFSTVDAAKLVERIKASGKRLTTIYISHGDPDFYFGLVALSEAFPQARVLATPQTIAHIRETSAGKLQFWGPKLGAGAPSRIVIPEPLQGDTIDLEGNALRIVGLDGPTPDRSFVWIEPIKTVLGGIPVMAGEHVWMADTQTPQSHANWLSTLDRIAELKPEVVIPGHFAPGAARDLDAVRFTADYIRAFDEETAKAKDSAALIAAMQRRYPGLGAQASLDLSAKVAKGEMKWP
ncbi:MBL fold metallo-hydrolase [Lysobacter sp. CA199]|uniref:MBL fold metallo-hydrolase n=1 Tax=Lysobacter sp. CA199 TaxID=3455608 RepID=UPI003F8D1949